MGWSFSFFYVIIVLGGKRGKVVTLNNIKGFGGCFICKELVKW